MDLQTEGGRASNRNREFVLTDKQFYEIADLIGKHAGIVLSDAKKHLVYGRLVRRLRDLDLSGFDEYLEIVTDKGSEEFEHFVNALTTNLTSFFREPKHFDYLASDLVPELIKKNAQKKELRVWSAGCSTGEEPYSIALALMDVLPANWQLKILATDLDSQVVARAKAGVYDMERVSAVSQERLKKYFLTGRDERAGLVKVKPALAEKIVFKSLNLLEPWPFKQQFDIVFCRNVVIYFDKTTQAKLFDRFANQMVPDGHLFVGHSETLYKVSDRFKLLGNTIYRRDN